MIRTTDITSVTEHRQNLREHLDRVRETGRPLFITSNGQTEAVVLSPEAYNALAELAEAAETRAMMEASLEDIKAGRTRPAKEAMADIAASLGIRFNP